MSFATTLYFTGTGVRAKNAADAFNEQHAFVDAKGKKRYNLSLCVRKQHLQLFELLARRLGNKLYKHDWRNEGLPPIYCNNASLSDQIGCCQKTIYNLLQRLQEANFITKKQRGSNFQYEIHFNEELLSKRERLSGKELAAKLAEHEQIEVDYTLDNKLQNAVDLQPQAPEAQIEKEKTLPHLLQTINVNNLSLNNAVDSVENSGIKPESQGLQVLVVSGSTESHVDKPENRDGETSGRETGRETAPRCAAPPAAARVSQAEAEMVGKMVRDIWGYCFSKLYKNYKFIAATEIIHAQLYFADGLLGLSSSEKRKKKMDEIIQRIAIVADWLNRKPGRFVPVPSVYFVRDNKKGFVATREWLYQKKENEARLQLVKDDYERQLRLYRSYEKAAESVDLNSWGTFKKALEKMEHTGNQTAYNALYSFIELEYKNQQNQQVYE